MSSYEGLCPDCQQVECDEACMKPQGGGEAMSGLRSELSEIVHRHEAEMVTIEPNEAAAILRALAQQPAAEYERGFRAGLAKRLIAEVVAESQQPAAVDGAISHADLCALSRVFNENNNLRLSRDQRINDWLGKHIAAALAARARGCGVD